MKKIKLNKIGRIVGSIFFIILFLIPPTIRAIIITNTTGWNEETAIEFLLLVFCYAMSIGFLCVLFFFEVLKFVFVRICNLGK